jgi:hypothetical protein
MRVLAALTELFVNAFQITRPRPEQRKQAEWIIGGTTLLFILLAAGLLIGMLVWAFHA